MSKNKFYLIASVLVFLLAAGFLITFTAVQFGKSESRVETHFKGTMGQTMYKFRSSLNAISENKTLSDQHLDQVQDSLLVSHAYAETLDFGLSPGMPLLVPAVESMQQIVDHLQQHRNADPLNWTVNYAEDYAKLLEFIDAMNHPLSRVYYEPDPQEGARITLTIRNIEDMVTYSDTLRNYVSSLK